ncbi:flagellar motor switch phosphatase FliY [Aquibacillus sp. 3ASR75-11]|uniref:Flagellar motor switch phosphatase FliY n=1 Tax=Terrihalobacillus insolitus TaxID=2950438 RepID=A0A9X3WRM1_9BACI|nr:flagellar motor switch phosphatase FliY [Terrihalobacillus insolitus]MDC3414127.1 flagellar motor switch phosphatase FliY [Terrihalobacillus insolitus]MDC3423568.1 flagellar motor switch phosphatase FliY [Terrihalobacillus insolitus]
MNDDNMLSQDEIDALLKKTEESTNPNSEQPHTEKPLMEHYLSELEQDALAEIGNISFGSSATTLSKLLNQKVDITTPETSLILKENLQDEFPQPQVGVQVNYTEGFKGTNLLVIKTIDAAVIADLMLGGDGVNPAEQLDDIHLSAVQEAMNQMMGTAATSMSTIFKKRIVISPPSISVLDTEDNGSAVIPAQEILFKVSFNIKIGNLIDSNIMQLVPVHFAKELVDQLLNPMDNQEETASVTKHTNETNKTYQANNTDKEPRYIGANMVDQNVQMHPAAFSNFENVNVTKGEQRNLNMLLDIPLQVTVELGQTKRTIKDILDLSSGSVIELDKLAGEPVDIKVNDKLIAKGEVVVIDENFGVRVTDILSQSDRLKHLN